MIEIKKNIDEKGNNRFKIITNEGNFEIIYGGTLDLYWFYRPKENIDNWPLLKTFNITKENYFLFKVLDELYTRIKEQKPYSTIEYNPNNYSLKDYAHEMLFQNNIIKWYSDDAPLEEASCVEVKRLEDVYSITFYQGKEEYNFPTFTVRFRNSGSRYKPYNAVFMNMYNCLGEYDFNYHQIHIEEYLYNQKLQRTKNDAKRR